MASLLGFWENTSLGVSRGFLPEATKRSIPHMRVCGVSVTHDPTKSLSEADDTPLPVNVPVLALGAS